MTGRDELNDRCEQHTSTTQEALSVIYINTHVLTDTQLQLLDGTETKSCFLQGEAFGQFCPLSLYIFLGYQASLPCPQQQSPRVQVEKEFVVVSTWQKAFCHLSVD